MKKRRVLLLGLIILLCVTVGFTTAITVDKTGKNDLYNNASERTIDTEYNKIKNLNKDDTKAEMQDNTAQIDIQEDVNKETYDVAQENTTSPSTEVSKVELSEEDKAVKIEIAKCVETNIDFKFAKQEKVNGKVFNLTFSEIENSVENQEKIVYKSEKGDIFKFDAKDGELREAIINSLVTQKTSESINKISAQKIVVEHINAKEKIDEYQLYSYKESEKGYNFIYTRYIGGYPSADKFSIKVGYDGNIVYISDFTDVFDGKELNYDKAFLDAKIKENSDETMVDWDSIKICIDEGKVAISYAVPEQCTVAILPLE